MGLWSNRSTLHRTLRVAASWLMMSAEQTACNKAKVRQTVYDACSDHVLPQTLQE